MYDALTGVVATVGTDPVVGLPWVGLDVGGVGYQVYTLERLAARWRVATETTQRLYCRLIVRQQPDMALVLYGFESRAERDLFNLLLGASGVGPKAALALLESLGVEQLVHAVVAGDYLPLTQAKGVGKKGAQKLVLELKEKLTASQPLLAAGGEDFTPLAADGSAAPSSERFEPASLAEAQTVLTSLGYSPQEQAACFKSLGTAQLSGLPSGVESTPTEPSSWSSETLLRYALKWLALNPVG